MTGHMFGAAGGAEAIATIMALREGICPPTINLDTPDPECDLDYTPNVAVKAPLTLGLSNSFGFGGHKGHFPGNPIVPGVILCEIMAQSCFPLFMEDLPGKLALYRGLDAVKFRSTVKPGDECEITARLVDHKGNVYVCDAQLSVAGKRAAQARITVALVPQE